MGGGRHSDRRHEDMAGSAERPARSASSRLFSRFAVLMTLFSGLRQNRGAVRPHVPLDLVEVLHARDTARRTFFARVYRVCRRAVRPRPGCLSCCPSRVRFCMIIVVHALLLFGLSRTPHRLSNCVPIYRRIGIPLISSSV